jgi:ferritin-like metal-binding protein YciE
MQTAHEFFLHGLNDIMDGEKQLVEALGKNAESASNPQLKKAFEQHKAQTEKQVERLQQVFESLGEEPESDVECKGIKGLVEEGEEFKSEDPSPDIADIEAAVGASKIERYEIAEYEALIRLARMMKHTEATRLLQQNLKEEQATLRKIEALGKKLKPEDMGMEEMEEQEESRGARRKGGRRAA